MKWKVHVLALGRLCTLPRWQLRFGIEPWLGGLVLIGTVLYGFAAPQHSATSAVPLGPVAAGDRVTVGAV